MIMLYLMKNPKFGAIFFGIICLFVASAYFTFFDFHSNSARSRVISSANHWIKRLKNIVSTPVNVGERTPHRTGNHNQHSKIYSQKSDIQAGQLKVENPRYKTNVNNVKSIKSGQEKRTVQKKRGSDYLSPAKKNECRTKLSEKQKRPLILIWTKLWSTANPNKYWLMVADQFGVCNCQTTGNRSLLAEADAVLFFGFHGIKLTDLPKQRTQSQYFVFFNTEAPPRSQHFTKDYRNYFNLTLTYRSDSDAVVSYAIVQKLPSDQNTNRPTNTVEWLKENKKYMSTTEKFDKLIREKTGKVAWIASNCKTPSGREKYIAQLDKYIQVHKYGLCSGTRTTKPRTCSNLTNIHHDQHRTDQEQCLTLLRKKYKFYLSFENTVCPDYVTEKFFERAAHFVIPVVLCRKTHEKVAQNIPFIAADDFKSPKYLAEYLKYLDRNITAYKEYFNYRKKFEIFSRRTLYLYDLCQQMSKKTLKPSVVPDMEEWWHNKSGCIPNYGRLLAKET